MLKKTVCVLYIIAVFCFCQTAQAASLPTVDANSKKFDLKHPTEWLETGGYFRFRTSYADASKLDKNAFEHDEGMFRFRARIWGKFKLTEDIDFNLQFNTEPRYYFRPDSKKTPVTHHEVLFDKLNLTFRNAFNLPLTIVAGRQEILLGTGWLICNGTPLDWSRTLYFDALRFTYEMPDIDTTADLILISNHADSAKYLKPINDRDMDLSEQDESGGILYFAKKTGKDAGIDLYFIYKHDTDRKIAAGSEGEIYTFGLRKYGRLNEHWQYDMDFAPQFGHKNGKSLGAFATNNKLIYNFNDENKNKITLGYEYLSGNDDSDKNFDKGWGRLDMWSNIYQGSIDSLDGRKIDNSNLHRLSADWERKLTEKMDMLLGHSLLFADENTIAGGTGGLSKSGNFRGQLSKATLKLKHSKNLMQTFDVELFFPGNFYNKDRNDVAVFAKTDLIYTW